MQIELNEFRYDNNYYTISSEEHESSYYLNEINSNNNLHQFLNSILIYEIEN